MINYLLIRITEKNNTDVVFNFILCDIKGKVLKTIDEDIATNRLTEVIGSLAKQNTKIVLLIPDHYVSYYIVDMPIRDPKKRMQALPFILEDKIISNIEHTHFSLGPIIYDNKYLVAVSNKRIIKKYIDLFINLNIKTDIILSDALCLYKPIRDPQEKNKYFIYLNKDNNLAYLLGQNIFILQLDNINIILDQLLKDNINIKFDLIKYKTEGLYKYYNNKVNIDKEEEVTNWFSFVTQKWFCNNKGNRINLADGLIEKPALDIKFNKTWGLIAKAAVLSVILYFSYNFLDNKLYTDKKLELDNLIKKELSSINIDDTQDLNQTQQYINRKIDTIQQVIIKEQGKSKFYDLLSLFDKYYDSNIMNIDQINYLNNTLEIKFHINKDITSITNIAEKLKEDNKDIITLTENSAEKDNYIWILSEKIQNNIK